MRAISQVMIVTLVLATSSLSLGQIQPARTADARTFPAPWRPAFGDQDPNANNGTSAATDANPNPSSGQPLRSPSTPERRTINANATEASPASANSPPATRVASRTSDSNITRITKTMNMLPNKDGQVWREYDISPYTSKITNSPNPQQAILDWILKETGTEMWFNQPMGILNADRDHIYVYHTPEIHNVVRRIVDRFVNTRGQVQMVDINLVTVENPNWRSSVYSILQPVEVQSPGVEAWMVSKENAARLLSQISRRGDFKQHSSGRLTAHDGQGIVLEKTRPRQFVRSLRWVPDQIPNYQPLLTTINEGYRLEISSLSSLDNSVIEATIKCDVDQVEKLSTVSVDVPGTTPGLVQQMDLQIPQLLSWRLHERFRWPNDQVLLLSCGVVAKPDPQAQQTGALPRLFNLQRNRADALVFIEYRGPTSQGPVSGNQISSAANPATPNRMAGPSNSSTEGWLPANR